MDACNYALWSRGPYRLEVGSRYLCLVRKGVHSALSANWSFSPQDLQVEWIMCQTCKKPSPSSWCYWLKISVKWIMHQKRKAPLHRGVKLLTFSRWKRRGETDIFCFDGWSVSFWSLVTYNCWSTSHTLKEEIWTVSWIFPRYVQTLKSPTNNSHLRNKKASVCCSKCINFYVHTINIICEW